MKRAPICALIAIDALCASPVGAELNKPMDISLPGNLQQLAASRTVFKPERFSDIIYKSVLKAMASETGV